MQKTYKLIQKLVYIIAISFVCHVTPAFAGDHDGCYDYIRVINNSNYKYYVTSQGTSYANNRWHAGGLSNKNYVDSGSEINIHTYPDIQNADTFAQSAMSENFCSLYHQYFIVARDDNNIDYKYEFKLCPQDGSLSLTNLKTAKMTKVNVIDASLDSPKAVILPKAYSPCSGLTKPEFTLVIDSSGHIDDNQTIGSTY